MFNTLKSLWRNLLRKAEVERELDDELRSCLQMLIDEKLAAGLDEAEARRQARIELGGIEQVKEAVRGARRGSLLEMIAQEFRLAARRLRRRPAFSLVASLTLALGIGASTAIFSVIDGVLFKPLPYPHSDRLVWVGHSASSSESPGWIGLSTGSVHVYQERTRTLQQLSAYSRWPLNLSGRGHPERVAAAQVTPNFFAVLGVSPLKGRLLSEQDGLPGAPLVALISYGLWQRRFGGDAGVLGQSLTIHSRTAEIVGVMPEEVRFPDDDTQLWIPLALLRAVDPGFPTKEPAPFPARPALARLSFGPLHGRLSSARARPTAGLAPSRGSLSSGGGILRAALRESGQPQPVVD